ncbi:Cupin, RmlC-type [Beauveria brongniartii RCEF 3172]|uniref:Cupin, RmlC-type n=1 Tax=Beauveria brongniartii RCEF 3172 TaxID=1081107 RepID=A0A166Z6K7_9HYPO|nr:Cupin, RmlC-type [Beauveria brongniartii RCEF 3172]
MPSPKPSGSRAVSRVPLPDPRPVPRTVSEVPLPSYVQPQTPVSSASSKLMSLNSAIMAAQREWEQKKEVRGQFSSSSTDSESSDSTASDDKSSPKSTKEFALTDSSARPITGEKRSPSNAALDASSRPTKRTLSRSMEESSGPSSPRIEIIDSALKVLQNTREVEVRAHLRDVHSRGAWLTFNHNDAIATRADGMLYDYYYAAKGRVESMSGALIPTNYQLDLSCPFPYVCPDIACGKSFDSARALGGHFSAAHKGSAYNDNCDGTFTKTGNFKRVHGESWRAIVVSRVSVTGEVEEGAYVDKNSELFTPEHVALTRPDPFTYVGQFTTRGKGYFEFLRSALVRELAQLPKRRQLPQSWIDFYKKKPVSLTIFGLALAYVTGVEVFGTDACNASLGETDYRLSDCSVAVPFGLSSRLRDLHFPENSCVGCYYAAEVQERWNNCSWATRPRAFLDRYARRVDGLEDSEEEEEEKEEEDDDAPFAEPLLADETAQKRRSARAVEAAIKAGKADILELPPPDATSRAKQDTYADSTTAYNKGRANAAAVRQSLEQPSTRFVYSQSRALTEPKTVQGGPRPAESYQPPPSGRMSRFAESLKNSTESFSHGPPTRPGHSAQTPPPQLEMESWEVAPGRMVDAANGENIAYSNAYLNGREPVAVSEDVAFNVITIKPGDKARWEAHDSQLRTCSVASGKIEMTMGAKKFGTGPNSLFIIRPGEACVATNKLYIDATVHCTTVKSYSLLS